MKARRKGIAGRNQVIPKAICAVYVYNGKAYRTFHDRYLAHEEWDGHWRYIFEDGNYSCDCNKSRFIQQQCDPTFVLMNCGDKIKTVTLQLVA